MILFLPTECKTPDSKEGVCVDLYDCPTLISLIDKADTNATAKTFLQKSHCGFNKKKKPKVCCFLDHIIPNSYAPIVENRMYIKILRVIIKYK